MYESGARFGRPLFARSILCPGKVFVSRVEVYSVRRCGSTIFNFFTTLAQVARARHAHDSDAHDSASVDSIFEESLDFVTGAARDDLASPVTFTSLSAGSDELVVHDAQDIHVYK